MTGVAVIEPADLAARMASGARPWMVHLEQRTGYDESHIEGALHLHPAALLRGGDGTDAGKMPQGAALQKLLADIGYRADEPLIAMDAEGGGWAGRLLWTAAMLGHENLLYLNGGMLAWRAGGHPVSRTPCAPPATRPPDDMRMRGHLELDRQDVMERLDDADWQFVDARSAAEYSGHNRRAMHAGHIPGALSCPWTDLMDARRQLRIREDADEYLRALGLRHDARIAAYCQMHHRSAFVWMVGTALGYRMSAYSGSWLEWGNDPDVPVERA